MKILILNGPNLASTGSREPKIYGNENFDDFMLSLQNTYKEINFVYFQSNSEGNIIDKLWKSENFDGIILNAGAYTHTSIAIADAVKGISVPVIEVHISNVFSRESYRHKSFIAPFCVGVISGFGLASYKLAVEYFVSFPNNNIS